MLGILLLSDGIDSPVAGWLMKRQGMKLSALNFSSGNEKKVSALAKKLGLSLTTIEHAGYMKKLTCPDRYRCILCKREMYRQAEALAEKKGARCIVTGESLGQVASQTLVNLAVLDQAVSMPVLRPLLGFDKQEIVKIAREIGTYDTSIEKGEPCRFVSRHPATRAKIRDIERIEAWNA